MNGHWIVWFWVAYLKGGIRLKAISCLKGAYEWTRRNSPGIKRCEPINFGCGLIECQSEDCCTKSKHSGFFFLSISWFNWSIDKIDGSSFGFAVQKFNLILSIKLLNFHKFKLRIQFASFLKRELTRHYENSKWTDVSNRSIWKMDIKWFHGKNIKILVFFPRFLFIVINSIKSLEYFDSFNVLIRWENEMSFKTISFEVLFSNQKSFNYCRCSSFYHICQVMCSHFISLLIYSFH